MKRIEALANGVVNSEYIRESMANRKSWGQPQAHLIQDIDGMLLGEGLAYDHLFEQMFLEDDIRREHQPDRFHHCELAGCMSLPVGVAFCPNCLQSI